MGVRMIVPVREVSRGKPKFGVWVITESHMAYVRMKEGSWEDAIKSALTVTGGWTGSFSSTVRAWEEYREMLKRNLKIELPEDFIENLESYAREGFYARIEETDVKRGKGFMGGESLDGWTPIGLKAGRRAVTFRVRKDIFEEEIKPLIQTLPIKSYKEARFWAVG